jgi:hypothetical protein
VNHNPIAYDFNGNVTAYRDWTYDAAGRMIQVKETIINPNSVSTYITSYNGDGQSVREYLQENPVNSNTYIVRSSVLDDIVTRLDNAGNKRMTLVKVDGMLVGVQHPGSGYSDYVYWAHTDPRDFIDGSPSPA